jgi:hypothetical protein
LGDVIWVLGGKSFSSVAVLPGSLTLFPDFVVFTGDFWVLLACAWIETAVKA